MNPVFVAVFVVATAPVARAAEPIILTLDASVRHQTIDGFGVNFNGTYYRPAQKKLLDLLITELGISLVRLDPYGQTDWETENDDADPAHPNWVYFNDRYSMPAFEASWAAGRELARRGVRVYLNVSGTVPHWMLEETSKPLVNKSCVKKFIHPFTNRPVHLRTDMYEEFAETVVSMASYARNTGKVKFDLFGPINETDCFPIEGPRVDVDEVAPLAKVIARHLAQAGLADVKLVVAENAQLSNDYLTPLLRDPEAMKAVGVFALHHYSDLPSIQLLAAHAERIAKSAHPATRLWLTEYGDLNDKDQSAANEWSNFSLRASKRVLEGLRAGVRAALWWDAFDNYHDHDKHLTYYGLVANDNHVYQPKKRFFAAKNLYKFVRPGAVRIGAEPAASAQVTVTAFVHDKDRTTTVFGVSEGGPRVLTVRLPAGSRVRRFDVYLTTPTLDCAKTATVAVKDGAAAVALPEAAVFTLVGR